MCNHSCSNRIRYVATLVMILFSPRLFAQSPPNTPVITEPAIDGQIVSPADVHMETGPFSDPDPLSTHFCTDWEIWTVFPSARVWFTSCITGVERTHTHMGDGVFEGSHAGRTEFFYDTDYQLRVRHRDDSGLWSPFAIRQFSTGSQTQIYPLELDDVSIIPSPQWTDEVQTVVILPGGPTPPSLRVEGSDGGLLLSINGNDGQTNTTANPPALANHMPVRIVLSGGSTGLSLPQSHVTFTDAAGIDRTIYLTSVAVAPSQQSYYWVSANGSTYLGNASQTEPDFSTLMHGPPVPWRSLQPGYKVEIVATGFQLPVNIAFVPNPGNNPDDPMYYVTELYGKVKVVRRNGVVSDYASNLLNFDPTGNFPGTGEQGLGGIVVDSASGDIFLGLLYDAAPPSGPHYPKIVRFHSTDGGLTAATQTTILDMPGETQGQSHFISNLSIGPDGKLYQHMGDGFTASTALNLSSYRGKILRLNLNGSAPSDNPFFNAGNGITATDYVFAYGLRNPFGGAWRSSDGFHYEVENGPGSNDRFAKVISGTSYGWNGSDASMTINAIYTWVTTHAPVNIQFIQLSRFAGSQFPASKYDHAFVTESGPTYATGPQARGKRIVEFVLSPGGTVVSGPNTLVEYNGSGKGTAVGLAAGPDGLYFTDLYKDLNYITPIDAGANILRVKYVGAADFSAIPTRGNAPLNVQFTDNSTTPGASSWAWNFGDNTTSTDQNPTHLYSTTGVYSVRLNVTGTNGIVAVQKNSFIVVGDTAVGLWAEYYDNRDLTGFALTRIDQTMNFDWGNNSPDPSMGSDDFSVRWTGRVQALYSQTYTLYTYTDDGVRLWVNGQLVIDRWVDQSPTEWSATFPFVAGQRYDIKMEYYERGGGAVARLSWSSPSQTKQVIPQNQLYLPLEAPLPIQLASFTGIVVGGDRVRLEWSTLSEINNYGFEVQSKRANAVEFQTIPNSFVPGHGTTNVPQHYMFTDSLVVPGAIHYRLKQMDLDGTVYYTDAISLDIPASVGGKVPIAFMLSQNYPNPFNPESEITFSVDAAGRATLLLYDIVGRDVAELFDGYAEPGVYFKATVNGEGLASGVYVYRLNSGGRQIARKMVLVK